MNRNAPVDYRAFRLNKLNTPEYRHLWYLLYWPLFGAAFFVVERVWLRPEYHPIHCALDDLIPFCELFLIPYLLWFVFLAGMVVYTLFFDVEAFRGLMKFIIVSYTAAIVIYILFPNCQELRPVAFPRDNPFTHFLAGFYAFDTNTNVCPSLHVIGSVAVASCAWRSRRFRAPGWRAAFTVTAALISVSTVFLKQHSLWDLLVALLVCGLAQYLAYGVNRERPSVVPAKLKKSLSRR